MAKDHRHKDLGNDEMRDNIFQTPEGYFDQLHDRIMDKVLPDEKPSLLDDPKLKENIFTVPDGYFEQLPDQIAEKTFQQSETRVVPLFQRSWIRYAAAAAVVLLSVYMFFLRTDPPADDWSDEAIIEYLVDENISNLDILASIEDVGTVLEDFINDELGALSLDDYDNPELEYDFEYLDY